MGPNETADVDKAGDSDKKGESSFKSWICLLKFHLVAAAKKVAPLIASKKVLLPN